MIRRIVLIVLLAVILAAAGFAFTRWQLNENAIRPLDNLDLSFSSSLGSSTFQLGQFRLGWDPTRGGSVTITHTAQPGKVQWASLPGKSFVAAALGKETVSDSRGSFFIEDDAKVVCAAQRIDSLQQNAGGQVVFSGTLGCDHAQPPVKYRLVFAPAGENQLSFSLEAEPTRINRTFLVYTSTADEHFFGFGEQFSTFDFKGRRLPIFISEQGVGRGDQPLTFLADLTNKAGGNWATTYAAVPHYITSQSRSLFLQNTEYMLFDLRTPDQVQIQAWSNTLVGRILAGSSPAQLVSEYTSAVGRMRPLPDWILDGAVIGMQGGTDKVRQVWQKLQDLGTPISAFWLQDWVGQRVTSFGKQLWWNWELDETRYPGWTRLVSDLHAKNLRLMLYISPFFADVSGKAGVRRNLFKEAADLGFLVKNSATGGPYFIQNTDFSAGLLDLTNPDAQAWMKEVIRTQLLEVGADGWMTDFGEALPYDAKLSSGMPAARFHNAYPQAWAELNRQVVDAAPDPANLVFFMRSAFTGSPVFSTLFWEGDQTVNWDTNDGIKSAVTGLLSSGLSGFAYNHSDIGGYTSINNPFFKIQRSPELLARWEELSAFTTVFRTHEGNLPEFNIQFYSDDTSLAVFSQAAKMYAAWGFYRKQLVSQAAATGLPVVRHPFLEFPQEPAFWTMSYQQFMVGSEFMVAPVLDAGAQQVRLYLPAGRWTHLWSGKIYGGDQGQWVTVAAPLGQPAVFYREGSPVGAQFAQNLAALGLK